MGRLIFTFDLPGTFVVSVLELKCLIIFTNFEPYINIESLVNKVGAV